MRKNIFTLKCYVCIEKYILKKVHCLSSCWVRHTVLPVNTLSSLNVHSALALRSPASPTLSNLSAVLFPLTGGTTTSFPVLALCSARWSNTHVRVCTQEKHTHLCLYTTTSCQSCFPTRSALGLWGFSGERSSAVILIQLWPIFVKHRRLKSNLNLWRL